MSAEDMASPQFVFEAEITVPDVYAAELRAAAKAVSYGWGVARWRRGSAI